MDADLKNEAYTVLDSCKTSLQPIYLLHNDNFSVCVEGREWLWTSSILAVLFRGLLPLFVTVLYSPQLVAMDELLPHESI